MRKLRFLSPHFSFAAASLVLVLSMVLPSPESSIYDSMTLSDHRIFDSEDIVVLEVAEPELREPARAAVASDYMESAPPSYANSINDQTAEMEMERRIEESKALEEVSFTPPEEKVFPYYINEEEYKLLCWCVEGEAHGKSVKHREIIAQVVFNRVFNPRFPDTVKGVVLAPRQFNAMDWYTPSYYDKFITPMTYEAVDAVLNMEVEDMSQGALYFCNPNTAYNVEWFDNCLVTLFELENHRFYTSR